MKVEYYYATWCGPCKVVGPIVEEIAKKKSHELESIKVEAHPDKALDRGVRNIPAILLIDDDDNVIRRIIGIVDKGELRKALA